jgi:hypothetical protein
MGEPLEESIARNAARGLKGILAESGRAEFFD